MQYSALVLGSGIQGLCVALALRKHGHKVGVIDMAKDAMTRASLTYEGKIHLGFIYGMDKTFGTGRKMVQDSLNFSNYVDYLLDRQVDWPAITSRPNVYLTHRTSLMTPDEMEGHFEKVAACYRDAIAEQSLNYLGRRPERLFERIELPEYVSPETVIGAFKTEEASVDQVELRSLLCGAVRKADDIELLFERRIIEVDHEGVGYKVVCELPDFETEEFKAPLILNCLWEGRTKIDARVGLIDLPKYSIRLKYGLVLKADDYVRSLDSITVALGAYGNIVVDTHRPWVYCSWYPECLVGTMDYGDVPQEWEEACSGDAPPERAAELARANIAAFRKLLPNLPDMEVIHAKAGMILAEGKVDINDGNSTFHQRNEIPVTGGNGFYSINTSKYTSAPRNAMILEEMLFGCQETPTALA